MVSPRWIKDLRPDHEYAPPRCYLAEPWGPLVFPGLWAPPSWGEQAGMNLSPADKQLLLQVARDSIAVRLQGKAATPVKATSAVLEECRGAFVSLHRRGQLRGCIGYIEAIKTSAANGAGHGAGRGFSRSALPPFAGG